MIGSAHWDNEVLQFSGSSLLWFSWVWVPSTILSFPFLLEEYQVKIRSVWEQMWFHEDFLVPNKWRGGLALASFFVPSDWLVILKIKRKALPVVTTIVDQKEYENFYTVNLTVKINICTVYTVNQTIFMNYIQDLLTLNLAWSPFISPCISPNRRSFGYLQHVIFWLTNAEDLLKYAGISKKHTNSLEV